MLYTNKFDLPDELYKALTKNRYAGTDAPSDFSVTGIISPVQQLILKQRYKDKIVDAKDATDMLFSMFGQIAHILLEEHAGEDVLSEERLYATFRGKTLSGQLDHYKNEIVTDYKTTACYKIMKGTFREWEEQLNCYAYLCRRNSLPVRSIRIVAILRDWHKGEVVKNPEYPRSPAMVIPITVWTYDQQEAFIDEKVKTYVAYENMSDVNLLQCTYENMWCDPTIYAVMKEGQKNCIKNGKFPTYDEAYSCITTHKDKHLLSIQERHGTRRRCEEYCDVKSVCVQYQTYLKEKCKNEED